MKIPCLILRVSVCLAFDVVYYFLFVLIAYMDSRYYTVLLYRVQYQIMTALVEYTRPGSVSNRLYLLDAIPIGYNVKLIQESFCDLLYRF